MKQDYQKWKITFINDGSTNNTEKIIHRYAEKESRIKGFLQRNQGVSAARNGVVEKATRDYLVFLDSDDWYKDKNCLKNMAKILLGGNSNILAFQYQTLRYLGDT